MLKIITLKQEGDKEGTLSQAPAEQDSRDFFKGDKRGTTGGQEGDKRGTRGGQEGELLSEETPY